MRVAPDRSDNSENVGVALSQNLLVPSAATITLYSADGLLAVQEQHDGDVADAPEVAKSDDDLTSLTWLQDQNLLRSVRDIPKAEVAKISINNFIMATESASNNQSSYMVSNVSQDQSSDITYDPQIHTNSKPPFSFSCLIFMAIENSPQKALPVKDIYVWIVDHFPYYRDAPTGWKNSVRHNLSLNKCFKKVDKSPNLGKGSLWMVEQRYRPCLIQALQKTPYQYHKFVRNIKKSLAVEAFNTSNGVPSNSEERNLVHQMQSFSSNVINEPVVGSSSAFYLKNERVHDTLEDVDAAAAMLVLKHGTRAFNVTPGSLNLSAHQPSSNTNSCRTEISEPLITTCPSEDHNYIYDCSSSNVCPLTIDGVSVANTEEIISSNYISSKEDAEERRKIAEGADALLNLAGIKTYYNTRKRYTSTSEDNNYSHQNKHLRVIGIENLSYKMEIPNEIKTEYDSTTDSETETCSSSQVSSSSNSNYNFNNISTDHQRFVEVDKSDDTDVRMKFYKHKLPSRRTRRTSSTFKEGKYCSKK